MPPRVSFILPARNEADQLPATLTAIRQQDTTASYETIVVDGASSDQTSAIARDMGARVIESSGNGFGYARNRGAEHARGEWLVFIDADTRIDTQYLDTMLAFVTERDLDAATSRWRFSEPRGARARFVEAIQPFFVHHNPPILYGFHAFVAKEIFTAAGGYPNILNEDIAFSHRVAEHGSIGVCPETLVSTSPRRLYQLGLTKLLIHYLRQDIQRRRSNESRNYPPSSVSASETSPSDKSGDETSEPPDF
jgi:glycosyltransferase involved in cell wall biosynthesis